MRHGEPEHTPRALGANVRTSPLVPLVSVVIVGAGVPLFGTGTISNGVSSATFTFGGDGGSSSFGGVFKDGAGFDTKKLLDSVRGHYGEY